MGKPSKRKLEKKKTRERADAKRKHELSIKRVYQENFPKFIFETHQAPPDFVQYVRAACSVLDLRTDIASSASQWLKKIKARPSLIRKEILDVTGETKINVANALSNYIGKIIFSILEDSLKQWIPFHDVQFMLEGRQIRVVFRSLLTASGAGGTIYYSRFKPTLDIDGQKKIVGFSRHAIERICERLVGNWSTYTGMGMAFAFFDECVYYERSDLFGGNNPPHLGFTFYNKCVDGRLSGTYVEHVLEEQATNQHYYRVGYCPAVIEGEFIKATSILAPGYHSTPEYGLIARSGLPREEIDAMRARARKMSFEYLKESYDFELLKWFHEHGQPQVIKTSREIYKHPF